MLTQELNSNTHEKTGFLTKRSELVQGRVDRRKALSTIGKVGVGIGTIVIGGVAYYVGTMTARESVGMFASTAFCQTSYGRRRI